MNAEARVTAPLLVIELPWPDEALSPNGRAHPMKKYRLAQSAKTDAFWVTRQKIPTRFHHDGSRLKLTITAHPKTARRPDDDNTAASCKAYRDGIALALGIDDNLFDQQPIEWGEPVKGGRILVAIG